MSEIDLETVTGVIHEVTGVNNLAADQDFYDGGVTSVQALPLLLELEARFGVSIPDERFIQVRTPRALGEMIADLRRS